MNQGSNFLGGSFSNRDNVRAPIQFRRESQPQHLKSWFISRTDPSIFISVAPVLLERSNEASWVFPALESTSHFLPQSIVSRKSDSNSGTNSSCCQRSDAWSQLEQKVIYSKKKCRTKKGALRNSSINWIFVWRVDILVMTEVLII